MSDDMRSEFIHALEHISADKGIRALVISGAGKGFCAGGNIAGMEKRMSAPTGEIAFNGWDRQQRVHHTQTLLHTMPKPTIAAVNGSASGLGADTALACDFLIGSEYANFTWSYINRGIIPDGGGMYLLPRRVSLLADAQVWAAELSRGSGTALALSKTILNQSYESTAHQVFAQGSQAQGICYTSTEHRNAVFAFLEANSKKG